MSSFDEIKQAVCYILRDDGERIKGTGFFVLPGGQLLTCHHVITGLKRLRVKLPEDQEPYEAEYLENYSNPEADYAVLKINGGPFNAVQLGQQPRAGGKVYGYGFRPSHMSEEPAGHSFSGHTGPGQPLHTTPPSAPRTKTIDPAADEPWNRSLPEIRKGNVHTFHATGGLEKGISGGPVYEPGLRKVVGLFRAVEGDEHAYVIPIEDVYATWHGLPTDNEAEVKDSPLDNLWLNFNVMLEADGGAPVSLLKRNRHLQAIFAAHRIFGGRQNELAILNRFVDEELSGYTFVTGPDGYGKTSLLASWAQTLESRNIETAVHFITPRPNKEYAQEKFCIQNLCQQLMAFHGLGVSSMQPLNNFSEWELRALYAELLVLPLPPDKRVVVILDGLDEALAEWTPSSDIFPRDLAQGIRVVFSARRVADKDWLKVLDVQVPRDRVLHLGRLSPDEVRDILDRSKLLSGNGKVLDRVAQAVYDISEGDPFYIRDLLIDLGKNAFDIKQLRGYPIGHNEYLRQWWKDASKASDERGFTDLMGTLAVARAPLGRQELINISDEDALSGTKFDLLIEKSARYVTGSESVGYQLSHGRIQEFVSDRLDEALGKYQSWMAEYCMRWTEATLTPRARTYMLLHCAHHLLDVGRVEDLRQLVEKKEWYQAKWEALGSLKPFHDDLGLAEKTLEGHSLSNLSRLAGYRYLRGKMGEIVAQVPPETFRLMVQLGYAPADILEWLKQMPDAADKVRASCTVAAELVKQGQEQEAVDLLHWAIDLISLAGPPGVDDRRLRREKIRSELRSEVRRVLLTLTDPDQALFLAQKMVAQSEVHWSVRASVVLDLAHRFANTGDYDRALDLALEDLGVHHRRHASERLFRAIGKAAGQSIDEVAHRVQVESTSSHYSYEASGKVRALLGIAEAYCYDWEDTTAGSETLRQAKDIAFTMYPPDFKLDPLLAVSQVATELRFTTVRDEALYELDHVVRDEYQQMDFTSNYRGEALAQVAAAWRPVDETRYRKWLQEARPLLTIAQIAQYAAQAGDFETAVEVAGDDTAALSEVALVAIEDQDWDRAYLMVRRMIDRYRLQDTRSLLVDEGEAYVEVAGALCEAGKLEQGLGLAEAANETTLSRSVWEAVVKGIDRSSVQLNTKAAEKFHEAAKLAPDVEDRIYAFAALARLCAASADRSRYSSLLSEADGLLRTLVGYRQRQAATWIAQAMVEQDRSVAHERLRTILVGTTYPSQGGDDEPRIRFLAAVVKELAYLGHSDKAESAATLVDKLHTSNKRTSELENDGQYNTEEGEEALHTLAREALRTIDYARNDDLYRQSGRRMEFTTYVEMAIAPEAYGIGEPQQLVTEFRSRVRAQETTIENLTQLAADLKEERWRRGVSTAVPDLSDELERLLLETALRLLELGAFNEALRIAAYLTLPEGLGSLVRTVLRSNSDRAQPFLDELDRTVDLTVQQARLAPSILADVAYAARVLEDADKGRAEGYLTQVINIVGSWDWSSHRDDPQEQQRRDRAREPIWCAVAEAYAALGDSEKCVFACDEALAARHRVNDSIGLNPSAREVSYGKYQRVCAIVALLGEQLFSNYWVDKFQSDKELNLANSLELMAGLVRGLGVLNKPDEIWQIYQRVIEFDRW